LPPPGAFGALTAARPWELVSTQDQILVQRWAAVEGLGQWFRLVLPRTALVAEIYLLNAPPLSGQLDPGQPPEADCIADECAPLAEAKRGTVLVGFYRRLDLLEAAGRVDANGEADAGGCATIETISHLAADTISVRQDPPAAGCPFDLFVWVPEALRDGYDVGRECDGVFGVATGSSVNDGRTGVVQRSGACAAPPPSPPSSPPSPPPAKAPPLPPPPAEPTLESKASGILRELAFGDVSGYGGLALVVLAALLCCCCCVAVLMCRQRTRKRRRKRSELRRNSLVTLAVGSATEPVPPPNTATWL